MSRERCTDEWVFTECEHSSQQCLLPSTERTTNWHPPRWLRFSGGCSQASGQPQPQRWEDGALHRSLPKTRSIPGPLRRSKIDQKLAFQMTSTIPPLSLGHPRIWWS